MSEDRSRPVLLLDPDNFTPYYVANLGHGLARHGWQVEWLTSPHLFGAVQAPDGVQPRNLFFRHLEPRDGGDAQPARKRIWWLRRAGKALSYPFDLRRLDRELSTRPPGVLHVQWALLPLLDNRYWDRWRRRGWKIVFTIHDRERRAGTNPPLSGPTRRLFRTADAVVVHSRTDLLALTDLVPESRVERIVPGGPGLFWPESPDAAEARRHLGLDPQRPIVLFFGLIKAYKGIGVLLRSLALVRRQVPEALLVIAGKIPGREGHWRRQIRRAEEQGGVVWRPGYVPQQEVSGYFAAADVVTLPYLASSTSGIVPLAAEAGRPVVASATGALTEMVEEGRNGLLVPVGDPEALAQALVELLTDRQRAAAMGDGHRQMADRYSWERSAAETDRLYRSL